MPTIPLDEPSSQVVTVTNATVTRRVNAIAKSVAKKFGEGSVLVVSEDDEADLSAGGITTGFQAIDDVLTGQVNPKTLETIPGTGVGLPRGRIVEVYGPESAGKTTLALMVAAQVQKLGGIVGYVDAEHALDTAYARTFGVKTEALLLTQPDNGEDALNQVELFVRDGVDLVVVDSVAALVPAKEAKGAMGDASMGSQARLMSQACRKLNSLLKPGGPLVIFINQIRMKLGVMFGNPETTAGGNALKFYASIRCDIRRITKLTKKSASGETRVYGSRVRLETVKNKIVPPFRQVVYDIVYGRGISVPSAAKVKADKVKAQAKYKKK